MSSKPEFHRIRGSILVRIHGLNQRLHTLRGDLAAVIALPLNVLRTECRDLGFTFQRVEIIDGAYAKTYRER